VEVTNVPAGYVLHSTTPGVVHVHVSGVRRRLFLLEPSDLRVSVDALLAQLGRRSFEVTRQDVDAPPGVTVTAVDPGKVVLDLEARSRQAASPADDP
jgi:hypothetical protein